MKTLMLTLIALGFSAQAQAAEFQIFENYNPETKQYTNKFFSTTEAPLSAAVLLQTKDGLCYKADRQEELDSLLAAMVDVYNAANEQPLEIKETALYTDVDGKAYYSYKIFDRAGWLWTNAKMRRCIR